MNEQDKALLQKLKDNPNDYEISVDNDDITVQEINPYDLNNDVDGEYERFSTFGEDFIVELLQELGFKAYHC